MSIICALLCFRGVLEHHPIEMFTRIMQMLFSLCLLPKQKMKKISRSGNLEICDRGPRWTIEKRSCDSASSNKNGTNPTHVRCLTFFSSRLKDFACINKQSVSFVTIFDLIKRGRSQSFKTFAITRSIVVGGQTESPVSVLLGLFLSAQFVMFIFPLFQSVPDGHVFFPE
jgi:hypothetical protein